MLTPSKYSWALTTVVPVNKFNSNDWSYNVSSLLLFFNLCKLLVRIHKVSSLCERLKKELVGKSRGATQIHVVHYQPLLLISAFTENSVVLAQAMRLMTGSHGRWSVVHGELIVRVEVWVPSFQKIESCCPVFLSSTCPESFYSRNQSKSRDPGIFDFISLFSFDKQRDKSLAQVMSRYKPF